MTIDEWNERYRTATRAAEDLESPPTPLVRTWAERLSPGLALDLACGAGRNSLYLACQGWRVTAVDGAAAAIDVLRARATALHFRIETSVADLTGPAFSIRASHWDLILACYYLQRDLFPAIRAGVRPGGCALAIVHISEEHESSCYKRAEPGELRRFFEGWEILHDYEGPCSDLAHRRAVAEIVARRPSP